MRRANYFPLLSKEWGRHPDIRCRGRNSSRQTEPAQDAIGLVWNASPGRTYQVEYSTNLNAWFASPTGEVLASGPTAAWTDTGPLSTNAKPFTVPKRFYRVFQFGTP